MAPIADAFAEYNEVRSRVSGLYKYVSSSRVVIDGIFQSRQIRFTQPWALNDPLEFNPRIQTPAGVGDGTRYVWKGITMPSYRDWVQINVVEARMNRYGILSLTKQPYSYEMWNLYADAHKGLLLDFKEDFLDYDCFSRSPSLVADWVRYVSDYRLTVDVPFQDQGFEAFDYLERELFFTKTQHWDHEAEYRVVRRMSESSDYVGPAPQRSYRDDKVYLFDFDLSCLQSVVFGAAMDPASKNVIIQSAADREVSFLQAIIDRSDEYRLYYLPISIWRTVEDFLRLRPQIFLADGEESEWDHVHVRRLAEIPYYESLKDSVDQFIESRRRRETE